MTAFIATPREQIGGAKASVALRVLDLKLCVAKLGLTGYDLRTTTQRSY